MNAKTRKKQLDLPEIASASLTEDAQRFEIFRHALIEQVCGQLKEYSTESFDEIDDSLFALSLSRSDGDNLDFLHATREIRNKKALFEETFLDLLREELDTNFFQLELSDSSTSEDSSSPLVQDSSLETPRTFQNEIGTTASTESAFEQLEIELALKAMQRRASKLYEPLSQQLNDIENDQLCFANATSKNGENNFVNTVCAVINKSRLVFNLTMDIKLIFLKQFEQSLLMKMEPVYLGLHTVLQNQSDMDLVDQFCSSVDLKPSSGAPSKRDAKSVSMEESSIKKIETVSHNIKQSADAVVVELCGKTALPVFVEKMIKKDWLEVMLLIGFNQGVDSESWNEAKQVAIQLLGFLADPGTKEPDDNSPNELKQKLAEGFKLIQLSKSRQDQFFNKFDDHTMIPTEAQTVLQTRLSTPPSAQGEKTEVKAAISEAGRKILDDDDLDDIVALLSDDQDQQKQKEKDESEDSLSGYLNLIDSLREDEEIEYVNDGKVQKCKIQKSVTADNSFQVTNRAGKVLLARSRVGLALSAKSGELRIGDNSTVRPQPAADQRTLIHTQTKIDPPTTH